MLSAISAEPDPSSLTIFVGRDPVGHWLVQGGKGQLEGRFISRETAWAFARAEARGVAGARLVSALHPLIPTVSFERMRSDEPLTPRAA